MRPLFVRAASSTISGKQKVWEVGSGISTSPADRRAADSFRRTPGSHGRNPDLRNSARSENSLRETSHWIGHPTSSNIIQHHPTSSDILSSAAYDLLQVHAFKSGLLDLSAECWGFLPWTSPDHHQTVSCLQVGAASAEHRLEALGTRNAETETSRLKG